MTLPGDSRYLTASADMYLQVAFASDQCVVMTASKLGDAFYKRSVSPASLVEPELVGLFDDFAQLFDGSGIGRLHAVFLEKIFAAAQKLGEAYFS